VSTNLARRSIAELIGTAFLLAAIVGSGIMGERLAGGNVGIALLANSLATGAALIALILAFGSISGAHFNPLVTLVFALRGDVAVVETPMLVVAQLAGAMLGVVLTNIMFDLAPISASRHLRTGSGQWLGEGLATFGLIVVIVLWAVVFWYRRKSFDGILTAESPRWHPQPSRSRDWLGIIPWPPWERRWWWYSSAAPCSPHGWPRRILHILICRPDWRRLLGLTGLAPTSWAAIFSPVSFSAREFPCWWAGV